MEGLGAIMAAVDQVDSCLKTGKKAVKAVGITAIAAVVFYGASKGLGALTKSPAMSYLRLPATTNPWINFGGGFIAAAGTAYGLVKFGSKKQA
jgi:hypothetical protein